MRATEPRPDGSLAGPHADLLTSGVAVRDGFLAPARVRELVACAELRRARGDFAAAGMGAGPRPLRREDLRGDLTCWLAEPLFEAERVLLGDLEGLRLAINREGLLGLFDMELHYAWYPPGAGYARHLDRPHGREQRMVSVILYLNEGWDAGAGGELRLFGAAGDFRDIEPVGGRLAYFITAGREHAVLPTRRPRLSISGWFRRRD